jgi:hypothetical protein
VNENKGMKVLVFTSSLRPGGVESTSVALANALAAEGLTVFIAGAAGPLQGDLDSRVTYDPIDDPHHAPVRVAHSLSLFIRAQRPDVIHSQGGSCAMVASIAWRASKLPCTRVLTQSARAFRRAPRWIAGPILRRCADYYFAVGPDQQADLESMGIPAEKISLLPDLARSEKAGAGIETAQAARTTIALYQRLLAAREPKG